MKIKMTCKRCGRDVMAEQAMAAGGECPWDGEPFSADYAVTLVNALRDAEEAGTRLEDAMGQIADIAPAFTVDEGTVVGSLKASLARLHQNLVQQG